MFPIDKASANAIHTLRTGRLVGTQVSRAIGHREDLRTVEHIARSTEENDEMHHWEEEAHTLTKSRMARTHCVPPDRSICGRGRRFAVGWHLPLAS